MAIDSSPRRRRSTIERTAAITFLVLGGCSAGTCDTSGLRQIAGKDPRGITFPGQELGLVGDWQPLWALGLSGRTAAIAGVDAERRLQIVQLGSKEKCVATTLPGAADARSLVPAAVEDLVATFESVDEAGRGPLQLFDSRCDPVLPVFEDARPVARSGRLLPSRLLIEGADADLLGVRVDDRESSLIDPEASSVTLTRSYVYELSAGQLVIRDMALKPLERWGHEVSEAAIDPANDRVLYVDGGGLYLLDSPSDEPRRLERDACAPRLADPAQRGGEAPARFVSYFAPCEDGELIVYDTSNDQRWSLGPATSPMAAARHVDVAGESHVAIFFAPAASDDIPEGSLAVSLDGESPTVLGPGAVDEVGRGGKGGVSIWLGAESDDSRIVRFTGGDDLEELVSGVTAFETSTYPERALMMDASGEGTLLALEGSDAPRVLAEGATSTGLGSEEVAAFGQDVDDDVGTLRIVRAGDDALLDIAEDVYLPVTRISFTSEVLIYLEAYAPSTGRGRLCARVLDTGDTFCEDGVSTFMVAIRPERGLAYVKHVAGEGRLYWAEFE